MQNMTYCGRIYQNPMRPTEIYICIGWNSKGNQVYPLYEPWMAAHDISQAEYDEIVSAVRNEFDTNAPIDSVGTAMAAMCLCQMTLGICFCPCLYLKQKVDSFNANAKELVMRVSNNKMSLTMVQMASRAYGGWVDSKGSPLMLGGSSKRPPYPGGPPLGYSLIMSTRSQIPWPRCP